MMDYLCPLLQSAQKTIGEKLLKIRILYNTGSLLYIYMYIVGALHPSLHKFYHNFFPLAFRVSDITTV